MAFFGKFPVDQVLQLCILLSFLMNNGGVTASNIEDYVAHNERQYEGLLTDLSSAITTFRVTYQMQVDILDYQNSLIETKIEEFRDAIDPLELISTNTRQCVRKYRNDIPTVSKLRSAYAICVNWFTGNGISNYLLPAEATLRKLSLFCDVQFKEMYHECQDKYPAQDEYERCIKKMVVAGNSFVTEHRKLFTDQINEGKCALTNRIRTTVNCHMVLAYKIISGLGATSNAVHTCINATASSPNTTNNIEFVATTVGTR